MTVRVMHKKLLFGLAPFFAAALMGILIGVVAIGRIERQTTRDVSLALRTAGHDWAAIETDGLLVTVTGTAPDEARRFAALTVAGETIDADRVIDRTDVVPPEGLEPPRYSIEILRNGPGISLIGLVPGQESREAILAEINRIGGTITITDMLDSADHAVPENWDAAVEFAITALRLLPSAKISVSDGRVVVAAISDSQEEKLELEAALRDAAPERMRLALDIKAPRPVIAPFTLRFVLDEEGARFDSCSADSEAAREAILAAARAAGLEGEADCVIGLGVPTPRWGEAAKRAIAAVAELRGGTLTFANADISLIAPADTPRDRFDDIVHALESTLPEVFSLHAALPERPAEARAGNGDQISEFVATRSPEGLVQMRGRLNGKAFQTAVNSFARARFGTSQLYDTTRLDPELPDGWPKRVLAGLEGLARLHSGSLVVQPEGMVLKGISTNEGTRAAVTQLFSEELGEGASYRIDITYEKRLDPLANLPTPEECVAKIGKALAARQITFAPGSGTIDDDALPVIDRIADILRGCAEVPMRIEIGGHTDSQGRETMNLALSQARAEAVLDALLERGVLTTNMSAQGYGETEPIAANATEEGREANRRIEFKLIWPVKSTRDVPEAGAAEEQTDGQN